MDTTKADPAPGPHIEKRKNGLGSFQILSDYIIVRFLSRLSMGDLVRLSASSSVFYIFCNEDALWKKHCLKNYGGVLNFKGTWKSTCMQNYLIQKNSQKLSELPKDHIVSNLTIPVKDFSSDYLYSNWYVSNVNLNTFAMDVNQIERVHQDTLTPEEFIVKFDAPCKPAMLLGVTDSWKAQENWKNENLISKYGDVEFRISHKDDVKVRVKMGDFIEYSKLQHDEAPLYIFDSVYGEHAPGMLNDYQVPKYFKEDFLELLGEVRPNYRWFVMGPMRSGSPWHIDPHGTSAWNALISGRKRWALYPPDVLPPGVRFYENKHGETKFESPFPIEWFFSIYPYLPPDLKPIEITQNPGETIFVPRGWWHCVLNIEDTVAVTQNFINKQNLMEACEDLLREGRSDDFEMLKKKMILKYPEYQPMLEGIDERRKEEEEHEDRRYSSFDYFESIKEVCEKHNIEPPTDKKSIIPKSSTTNLVFLFSGLVFKFYRNTGSEEEEDAEESFQKESQLYETILSKMSESKYKDLYPTLKYKGRLNEQHDLKWKWPYIVTNQMEGKPIDDVYYDLNQEQLDELSTKLAPILKEFNQTPTSELTKFKNEFLEYMSYQREHVTRRHNEWGTLTFSMIGKIESYLPKQSISKEDNTAMDTSTTTTHKANGDVEFVEDLVSGKFYLLHGDVTDENVLLGAKDQGEEHTSKKPKIENENNVNITKQDSSYANKVVSISGLIDFGDAMIGDLMYELVSLHISVFKCDKKLLRIFLENYGKDYFPCLSSMKKFTYVAMCYTLLHPCDAMRTVYQYKPGYRSHQSWEDVADAIWNLDQ